MDDILSNDLPIDSYSWDETFVTPADYGGEVDPVYEFPQTDPVYTYPGETDGGTPGTFPSPSSNPMPEGILNRALASGSRLLDKAIESVTSNPSLLGFRPTPAQTQGTNPVPTASTKTPNNLGGLPTGLGITQSDMKMWLIAGAILFFGFLILSVGRK